LRDQLPSRFERYVKVFRSLALIAISLVILNSSYKMIKSHLAKGDTEVYLYAAGLIVQGEEIYPSSRPAGQVRLYYLYPPLFALLFVPLLYLPIEIVIVLWTLLSALLTAWVVIAFYRVMTDQSFFALPVKARWVIGFFSILLTSRFLMHHLAYGQANILVLALAVFGLRLMQNEKSQIFGGLSIGVSMVIKVVTFPLGLWFPLQKNFRALLGVIAGVMAGLFLPALVLGWERNWRYLTSWIESLASNRDLGRSNFWPLGINVSPHSLLHRFFSHNVAFEYRGQPVHLTLFQLPEQTLQIAGYLISLAMMGAILFYHLKYKNSAKLVSQSGGIALIFCLIPLMTPSAQKHYFVFLLPSYIYVVYVWYRLKLNDRLFRALVIASFAFASLTTDGICGRLLGDVFVAVGCITWGTLLLATAIFRAAKCLCCSERE